MWKFNILGLGTDGGLSRGWAVVLANPPPQDAPWVYYNRNFIATFVCLQGVQMQERNLFLFNDLLLIAKERSSSHFKLKDQVRKT